MIKSLIDKILGKTPAKKRTSTAGGRSAKAPRIPTGKRVDVPASEHGIDLSLVDDRARKVVETLQEAGYEAYIVGGAVRDLILGHRPKDFDVATNATPEQVKGLFRRAFIIGRRFRIVHVVYGRGREHEVIEVSTFRAYLDNDAAEQVSGNEKTSKRELADKSHVVDASGRVLRDNVWGPQDQDAARRDFTINAMYYDPRTGVVVDYHGGIQDAKKRVLRMIGHPETRYREDPVRIIRAARFAAKLGFELEAKTAAPVRASSRLLADVVVVPRQHRGADLAEHAHHELLVRARDRFPERLPAAPVRLDDLDVPPGGQLDHRIDAPGDELLEEAEALNFSRARGRRGRTSGVRELPLPVRGVELRVRLVDVRCADGSPEAVPPRRDAARLDV